MTGQGTVGINEHHRRTHRADGGRAHFEDSDSALLARVEAALAAESFTERPTDAGNPTRCVRLLDASGFWCGIVRVEDGQMLRARPARPGEPYMTPRALPERGSYGLPEKTEAVVVDVFLYSAAALSENAEQSTGEAWEVVGMSARPFEGDEPPHPVTIARNVLGLSGGTSTTYTAEEIAHAILHWSQHALLDE